MVLIVIGEDDDPDISFLVDLILVHFESLLGGTRRIFTDDPLICLIC